MTELLSKIPRNITSSPLMAKKKEWIATAAMLAGSVASSLIGGASARKKAQKAEKEANYRKSAEKAWYDKEYNTDYLDTAAGQNLMRRAQEVQDSYVRKADGAAAVGGGTASSVAQAKESANKAMGDTIANIAAKDTSRKQQVADKHLNNVQDQSTQMQAIYQQQAQNTSNASQNMSNVLMSAGVNRLGSQLDGAKSTNTNTIDKATGASVNTNVTPVAEDLTLKTNTQGVIRPTSGNGGSLLDNAVGDLMKRKPNIHV